MSKQVASRSKQSLKAIQPNAAGIDLGSKEHWVAEPPGNNDNPNVKCFDTTTPELYRLADWLQEQGVETVAMESTGVYWIPLFEVLDSRGFQAVLVNARQISNVPGRKTDILDHQWIQLLHSCGLLRGSFRPSDDICRLRALIRERSMMVNERADWVRRMQKYLDQMNVRVHWAVSDITGLTDMAIIPRNCQRRARSLCAGQNCAIRIAAIPSSKSQKSSPVTGVRNICSTLVRH